MTDPTTPQPPAAGVGQAAAGGGRRLLIVDDNRDAAELLRELLQLEGYVVRVAFDPHEALAVFDDFAPVIALLDIGLPGMSGHELAQRLRERHGAQACALVALTGYGQPGDLAQGARSGFAAYLVKPVEFETLMATLESIGNR